MNKNSKNEEQKDFIPLARLIEAIPAIEWGRGHSGILLTDEQARQLDALWDANS